MPAEKGSIPSFLPCPSRWVPQIRYVEPIKSVQNGEHEGACMLQPYLGIDCRI